MWTGLVLLSLVAQVSPPANVRIVRADMAIVTLDTPVHRGGQTFLTWTEVAGAGVTYSVYRETSQITSLAGLTPVATGLTQDSGRASQGSRRR